ncbi:MAG: FAD-dependent oxidoreductase, partial [Pseudomonadota bacterium]
MRADYIVVGAGSAGCAVAYRLAEAGHSVIVVEAGGSDAGPLIQMPAALSYPMNMLRYDWGYKSEPEPHLGGRQLAAPRGRVIGGSSSINGMVWVRGHHRDYDAWAALGASGWAARDVMPYFDRLESWTSNDQGGDPELRGKDGPVHVTRGPRENPLFDAFVGAATDAGYSATPDYNGHRQEGVGPTDQTIHKGRRWSANSAYLKPAIRDFGVRLVPGEARRIVFDGTRAIGVEVGTSVLKARRDIILAASTFNSPKLLLQSGVGPAQDLKALGIPVVADRPGVGQNLQDHLEVYVQAAAAKPITLYKYYNLFGMAYVGARWLFTRKGPGATNQIETLGFIRSRPGIEYPDLQLHFLPIAMRYDGQVPPEGHGFQIHVGPMRSKSRGAVTLGSPNPALPPKIRFNYMSDPSDWADFRTGVRLVRDLSKTCPIHHPIEAHRRAGFPGRNRAQGSAAPKAHVP